MTEEERQDEIQKKLDKKLSDIRLRVLQIANTIIMKPEGRDPYTVETLAIELRHLAYQTRFFQKAKELSADRRSLAKRVVRGVRLLAFHEVDRLFEVFGLDLVIGLRDEADRHC